MQSSPKNALARKSQPAKIDRFGSRHSAEHNQAESYQHKRVKNIIESGFGR